MAFKGCCDVVNRGVALYKGKVFVGTFDGRLVALDAATGKPVWEKDTIEDRSHSYTVTGAPRVIKGKVIIGNGGAEYGVRGYITAYDAETGDQKWRWYTVPGDPAKPFEDASWPRPPRPGTRPANGGSTVAAGPCGTPWPTTPNST
jgi:quinohemoprotein ethanol dehydrogenase